jgi:hypothetical protein
MGSSGRDPTYLPYPHLPHASSTSACLLRRAPLIAAPHRGLRLRHPDSLDRYCFSPCSPDLEVLGLGRVVPFQVPGEPLREDHHHHHRLTSSLLWALIDRGSPSSSRPCLSGYRQAMRPVRLLLAAKFAGPQRDRGHKAYSSSCCRRSRRKASRRWWRRRRRPPTARRRWWRRRRRGRRHLASFFFPQRLLLAMLCLETLSSYRSSDVPLPISGLLRRPREKRV